MRAKFFESLYKYCEDGYVEFRYLPVGKGKGRDFVPLDRLCGFDSFPEGKNVFFGIATRDGKGGAKANLVQIPVLWIDIDHPNGNHRKLLKDFPYPPTAIVHSGGGLHVYWRLSEPLGKEDIPLVEHFLRRLIAYFEADPSGKDATRILRVPGTLNFKPIYEAPREVRVLKLNEESELDLDDLDLILPEDRQAQKNAGGPGRADAWYTEIIEGVGEPGRHDAALRLAARWAALGLSDEEITHMLLSWNEKNRPPKPSLADPKSREFTDILRYVREKGGGPGGKAEDPPPAGDAGLPWDMEGTDLFYAKLFVGEFSDRVKFAPGFGWLVWDGKRWQRDPGEKKVGGFAASLHERVLSWGKGLSGNSAKRYYDLARKICSASKIKAALTLAACLPEIVVDIKEFDQDPTLLNCLNGTVDLKSGELLPHDPRRRITKLAPFEYRPDQECRRFKQFLSAIFCNDSELIRYVQKALGYSMTGRTDEHKFFTCWGSGRNGKSTLFGVIESVLGDYAKTIASDLLLSRRIGTDSHPTGKADLFGARVCFAQETEENRALNASLIKNLTGGDTIKARFMHKDYFEFKPTHTIWLATNYKPVLRDTTFAMRERLALIPFTAVFSEDRRDPRLKDKLLAEGAGILSWLVRGAVDWFKEGLGQCSAVEKETQAYISEMDKIQGWLETCCTTDPNAVTPFSELYDSYSEWATKNSLDQEPLSKRAFAARLDEKGFQAEKRRIHGKMQAARRGIKIQSSVKNEAEESEPDESATVATVATDVSVFPYIETKSEQKVESAVSSVSTVSPRFLISAYMCNFPADKGGWIDVDSLLDDIEGDKGCLQSRDRPEGRVVREPYEKPNKNKHLQLDNTSRGDSDETAGELKRLIPVW